MANSNTAHSRALRSRTAVAHRRELIASGKAKHIGLLLPIELANRFDVFCKTHELTRTKALEKLLDHAGV